MGLSVCLSVCPLSFENRTAELHQIFMRVACSRDSDLILRRCDTLCTSGFMDDVVFAQWSYTAHRAIHNDEHNSRDCNRILLYEEKNGGSKYSSWIALRGKVFCLPLQYLYPPSERSELARYHVMLFSFRQSVCAHSVFRCKYLENGSTQRLGTNCPRIGNGLWRIEWWRHRWRHVTVKGPRRDPNIFKAPYFKNGSRYRLGYNGAPIGNGMRGIKWSRDRRRHVTQKGQSRDLVIFRCKYLASGLS